MLAISRININHTSITMVSRTRRSKINRRNTRRNRKLRGGAKVYKFDAVRLDNLLKKIALKGNPEYCPDGIGGLEPDNTVTDENAVMLAGRGASGSEDACQFKLDKKTGEITFETIGEADDMEAGNEWLKTKDNIIEYLKRAVVETNNNNA